jgi:predicted phosphodiesterase
MKYAIISDIHSNLEALNTTLQEIDKQDADKIICLGDIVGYGASPNECVDMIRERKIDSVMGNHDIVTCGKKEPDNFNPIARDAALWTRYVLTKKNKEFLYDLPDRREFEDFIVVHGAISDPDRYVFSTYDALPEFNLMKKERVCFFGHTHIRSSFVFQGDVVTSLFDYEINIKPKAKYLINPGSVGQPRDRDPRASFLTYDTDNRIVEFTRVEYDLTLAQKKIKESGLDSRLADRLAMGR